MKRALKSILVFLGGLLCAAGVLALLRALLLVLFVAMLILHGGVGDELLETSVSPTRAYELEVHRINPGATEPYTIRVLCRHAGKERQVYRMRGQEEVEVAWLSESVVRIGSVVLDLAAGERYEGDLHYPETLSLRIDLQAADVSGVEVTFGAGGECFGTRRTMLAPLFAGDPPLAGSVIFRLAHLRDIPMENALKQGDFWLTAAVHTTGGEVIPIPQRLSWHTGWHRSHTLTLTGSAAQGYAIRPEFTGCTVLPAGEGP